ncbi:MAG: flagellar assembly protein FliW [Leptospiraceae bacterium]|nr:flagellar assembly protein FliW [Leptospiraceae bacterium]MCZ8346993.1 flagellar assembly protein FliW [Leptospiraceae bacterium]PJE01023.1 MAG: flagellar assembly protein FliW [Leptospira sp.]
MVELLTKPFGKIEIYPEQILNFEDGLLGFETYNKFALIEENEESPFKWLQSVQEQGLAFIVIQPYLFIDDYKPSIPNEELSEIGLEKFEEALVFVIVTIPLENPNEMTANLQGPILINKKNSKAKQFISRDDKHPVRYKMIEGQA